MKYMSKWEDFRAQRVLAIKNYCQVKKNHNMIVRLIARVILNQIMQIYKKKWTKIKAEEVRRLRFQWTSFFVLSKLKARIHKQYCADTLEERD